MQFFEELCHWMDKLATSKYILLQAIPEFEDEYFFKLCEHFRDVPYPLIEFAIELYHVLYWPRRCDGPSYIAPIDLPTFDPQVGETLSWLSSLPQPTQRSPEWYQYRYNMITASDCWKAINTDAKLASLIKEKSSAIDLNKFSGRVYDPDNSLHWGQKYEDVSVQIYERWFACRVGSFGCIRHPTYPFIGASPDGIVNFPETCSRYGRMLEIKNIKNREINGVPKEEYWIQMQIQMEVCNLDLCDFLETRFLQYDNEHAFWADSPSSTPSSFLYTSTGKPKGAMIYLARDHVPHYIIAPLDGSIASRDDFNMWEEKAVQEFGATHFWVHTIFWWLEEYSLTLVRRNRHWFNQAIIPLQAAWNGILAARPIDPNPGPNLNQDIDVNVNVNVNVNLIIEEEETESLSKKFEITTEITETTKKKKKKIVVCKGI